MGNDVSSWSSGGPHPSPHLSSLPSPSSCLLCLVLKCSAILFSLLFLVSSLLPLDLYQAQDFPTFRHPHPLHSFLPTPFLQAACSLRPVMTSFVKEHACLLFSTPLPAAHSSSSSRGFPPPSFPETTCRRLTIANLLGLFFATNLLCSSTAVDSRAHDLFQTLFSLSIGESPDSLSLSLSLFKYGSFNSVAQ